MKRNPLGGIQSGMKYVFAFALLLALVAGLAGIKYKQISTLIGFGEAAAAAGPPPEAVATARVGKTSWEGVATAVGSVAAVRGVTVSAEVPGVVKAIRFESGAAVRAGQVLVELDSSVERAQLATSQARLKLAEINAGRSRRLTQEGAATRAQLDNDESQLETLTAELAALKAQIERKTVRAPFAGRLGIRNINLGQYLNAGTPITVLESLGSVYVDFNLPQQQLSQASVGTPVRASIAGATAGAAFEGKIAAIDPSIDEATRTIKVRAELANLKDALRPGMFVNVSIVLERDVSVVNVPATAIVHAPYGDSVFVVEDKKDKSGQVVMGPDGKPAKVARQQFVRVGGTRGDFVAIAEGVSEGQEVVVSGAFKLRNGAPIAINNGVKLNPSLTPSPENR